MNLNLPHLQYYSVLARLPQFALARASNFRITPRPVMLVWECTYRCPSRCVSCSRWQTTTGPELPTSDARRLIAAARLAGVRFFVFSGGDPVMRGDITELGRYARSLGMMTVLCTTGLLITQHNADALMAAFDVFELPVDSLHAEINDKLRGRPGILERTLQALDLLATRREARHGIEITSVVRGCNCSEMGNINRHFAPRGFVTAMQPIHQGIYGAMADDDSAWAREVDGEWQRMVDEYVWHDPFSRWALTPFFRQIPRFIVAPESLRHTYRCFAGSYIVFVDPTGDVRLCEGHRRVLGNIRTRGLQEIWQEMRPLRQWVTSTQRDCDCWLLCTTPPSIALSAASRYCGRR